MQSAPPKENEDYDLPPGGRPDNVKATILSSSSRSVLTILDNQAVTIHEHSLKGNRTSPERKQDSDRRANRPIWCHQDQLCFVHIFLILDTLYNCYQKEDFPTGYVMKKLLAILDDKLLLYMDTL